MITPQRLLRGARRRLSRKPKMHVLHNRKTAGSAVKTALRPVQFDGHYHLIMHGPPLPLSAIPAGEQFVFTVREPLSRFVSGFNGRKHKSGHEEQPLTADEVPIFERFAEPNELAEALYSSSATDREAAEYAMKTVRHFQSYWEKFESEAYLLGRREDLFMILFQDSLTSDFDDLAGRLGVEAVLPPTDSWHANTAPAKASKFLSEAAEESLREWFRKDIEFYALCEKLRADGLA